MGRPHSGLREFKPRNGYVAAAPRPLPAAPPPHAHVPPAQVTFDEKSPHELLQILNDVFAALDSAHERDVRDEPPEVAGPRMINFLAILKFPLPPDVCVPAACRRLCLHARACDSAWWGGVRWGRPPMLGADACCACHRLVTLHAHTPFPPPTPPPPPTLLASAHCPPPPPTNTASHHRHQKQLWSPATPPPFAALASEAFKGGLVSGDRNAIYPVLEYVLSKFPALQKRAYLAKFLVNVEVPPEILHEEGACPAAHPVQHPRC